MKTLIISPTYNEKKNIQQLVDLVLGENPEFHLLIVDDNSPDGTGDKVKSLQSVYKNLFLETRSKKLSKLGSTILFSKNQFFSLNLLFRATKNKKVTPAAHK